MKALTKTVTGKELLEIIKYHGHLISHIDAYIGNGVVRSSHILSPLFLDNRGDRVDSYFYKSSTSEYDDSEDEMAEARFMLLDESFAEELYTEEEWLDWYAKDKWNFHSIDVRHDAPEGALDTIEEVIVNNESMRKTGRFLQISVEYTGNWKTTSLGIVTHSCPVNGSIVHYRHRNTKELMSEITLTIEEAMKSFFAYDVDGDWEEALKDLNIQYPELAVAMARLHDPEHSIRAYIDPAEDDSQIRDDYMSGSAVITIDCPLLLLNHLSKSNDPTKYGLI